MLRDKNIVTYYNVASASTSDGPATTDAALAALAAEAGLIDPVQEPSGGLSFMVATDDGAGGDDKMDDSCNGNEATTAAALVSQIGAGEPMQVDGDGNFILPQVDGPMDTLLSDDEKMDADEEPTLQNVTESANVDESAAIAEQDPPENVPLEESILKDEVASSEATTVDLPESVAVTADEAPEKTEGNTVENQSNDTEMSTTLDTSDNAELPIEKETEDNLNPLDETKEAKSELPLLQSPAEASSEQTSLTEVADPAAETQQDETTVVKDEKSEPFDEKEKFLESINLPTEDTDMPQLPPDEVQNIEEKKEPEADLPVESSPLVKAEETHEPMDTDDIKSTSPIDTANMTPVTTSVATPSIQMKLEEKESVDEEKLTEPPVSSINGVATPLEKETENVKKIHTPVKMDIPDDSVIPKRETMNQEKINDARSETGDDSTALTTLATAALGSAESAVKVKNEQVYILLFHV